MIELYKKNNSVLFKIAFRLFQEFRIPVGLPDKMGVNKEIRKLVEKNVYDVIWIDIDMGGR